MGTLLRLSKVEIVKSTTWKGVRLSLVAGLVAATGIIGTNALTASGQTGPSTEDVGTLELTVNGSTRTGQVDLLVDGAIQASQTISAVNACTTITTGGDPLLDISTSPAGSTAVLQASGLGLLSGGQNCGTEGMINLTETLSFELSEYFDSLAFEGVYVSSTALNVIRPKANSGGLTVTADGTSSPFGLPLVGPNAVTVAGFKQALGISGTQTQFNRGIYLASATFTLVKERNEPPVAGFTFVPNVLNVKFTDTSSDPDGTVEEWAWDFGDPDTTEDTSTEMNPSWTYSKNGIYTVKLTVTDNRGAESSTIQDVTVVGEAVFCSRTVREPGGANGAATVGIFTRAENGDSRDLEKVKECEDVGVTVDIEEDSVFWNNDTVGVNGNGQDVKGLFEIEWTGVAPSEFPVEQERRRYINYQGERTGAYFAIQWCTAYTKSDGGPSGFLDDPATPDIDESRKIVVTATQPQGPIDVTEEGAALFPANEAVGVEDWTDETKWPAGTFVIGTVPWCLVENSEVLQGQGDAAVIVQTQLFYGAGDPRTPLAR